MDNFYSYQNLIKPFFAPPAWVFGPVWSFLYTIIFLTFGYVFYLYSIKKIKFKIILPFLLNLLFNFSFTYFQFELNNNLLASIDIVLVLVTLAWAFKVIWKYNRNIVYLNIPYFLWVFFATILQFSITILNF